MEDRSLAEDRSLWDPTSQSRLRFPKDLRSRWLRRRSGVGGVRKWLSSRLFSCFRLSLFLLSLCVFLCLTSPLRNFRSPSVTVSSTPRKEVLLASLLDVGAPFPSSAQEGRPRDGCRLRFWSLAAGSLPQDLGLDSWGRWPTSVECRRCDLMRRSRWWAARAPKGWWCGGRDGGTRATGTSWGRWGTDTRLWKAGCWLGCVGHSNLAQWEDTRGTSRRQPCAGGTRRSAPCGGAATPVFLRQRRDVRRTNSGSLGERLLRHSRSNTEGESEGGEGPPLALCADACRKDRATSRRDFRLTPEPKCSLRLGGVSALGSHGGAAPPDTGAAFSLPPPAGPFLKLNLLFALEGVALGWGARSPLGTDGHSCIATVVGAVQLRSNWAYSSLGFCPAAVDAVTNTRQLAWPSARLAATGDTHAARPPPPLLYPRASVSLATMTSRPSRAPRRDLIFHSPVLLLPFAFSRTFIQLYSYSVIYPH